MKAIRQIIDYLHERGDLSTGQMSELAYLGLIEWDRVPQFDFGSGGDTEVYDETPIVESEIEDQLELRSSVRKGRGRKAKIADLTEGQLCRALGDYFARVRPAMAGLVRLAEMLGELSSGAADWPAAAIAVRKASVEELAAVLETGLRTHAIAIGRLWNFVAEEEFRRVLPDAKMQGPVATAFRMLMAVPHASTLGRYGKLLRHIEVQQAFNLRMAQRNVVRAWAELYARQPEFVNRLLLREKHWLAGAATAIVERARQGRAGEPEAAADEDDFLGRWKLDAHQANVAWAHAVFMDPRAVLPMLKPAMSKPR